MKNRLVEKTVNTTLETTPDIAKMFAESKFYPDERYRKSK